jgi:hypothetical protein
MPKFFFLFVLFFSVFVVNIQAQDNKKELDKLFAELAPQICDCFNKQRDASTDKEMLKLLTIMQKEGDEKAEAYLAKLSANKQAQIAAALVNLEAIDYSPFDDCLYDKTLTKMEAYKAKVGVDVDVLAALMPLLKKKKKCKMLYTFMTMAQQPK